MRHLVLIFFILNVSLFAETITTVGPRGETPVPSRFIQIREEEKDRLRDQGLSLAIAFHDLDSYFSQEVVAAILEEAEFWNIQVIFTQSADFSVEAQRTHYQELLITPPDLLITLPLSPDETTSDLRALAEKGTSIAFLSNLPRGFLHPQEYAGVVTDDLFGMGLAMAELIVQESGWDCRLLYLYHDADYYVTNQRDQALLTVLNLAHPQVHIINKVPVMGPGYIDESFREYIISQQEEIDAIYAPWATIADEVLKILQEEGLDMHLYTIDKSYNTCLDMLIGVNQMGIVTDDPREIGRALLVLAILHHLNEPVPPFAIVPVNTIDRSRAEEECAPLIQREGAGDF